MARVRATVSPTAALVGLLGALLATLLTSLLGVSAVAVHDIRRTLTAARSHLPPHPPPPPLDRPSPPPLDPPPLFCYDDFLYASHASGRVQLPRAIVLSSDVTTHRRLVRTHARFDYIKRMVDGVAYIRVAEAPSATIVDELSRFSGEIVSVMADGDVWLVDRSDGCLVPVPRDGTHGQVRAFFLPPTPHNVEQYLASDDTVRTCASRPLPLCEVAVARDRPQVCPPTFANCDGSCLTLYNATAGCAAACRDLSCDAVEDVAQCAGCDPLDADATCRPCASRAAPIVTEAGCFVGDGTRLSATPLASGVLGTCLDECRTKPCSAESSRADDAFIFAASCSGCECDDVAFACRPCCSP